MGTDSKRGDHLTPLVPASFSGVLRPTKAADQMQRLLHCISTAKTRRRVKQISGIDPLSR
ncbi:hypothetical protein Ancab_014319 [Ancistrocladus abbreviatus]